MCQMHQLCMHALIEARTNSISILTGPAVHIDRCSHEQTLIEWHT